MSDNLLRKSRIVLPKRVTAVIYGKINPFARLLSDTNDKDTVIFYAPEVPNIVFTKESAPIQCLGDPLIPVTLSHMLP